jgi:hypothetical protein
MSNPDYAAELEAIRRSLILGEGLYEDRLLEIATALQHERDEARAEATMLGVCDDANRVLQEDLTKAQAIIAEQAERIKATHDAFFELFATLLPTTSQDGDPRTWARLIVEHVARLTAERDQLLNRIENLAHIYDAVALSEGSHDHPWSARKTARRIRDIAAIEGAQGGKG